MCNQTTLRTKTRVTWTGNTWVSDAAADKVSVRSPKSSLAEVCARLGLDLEQVRTLAGQTTLYLI